MFLVMPLNKNFWIQQKLRQHFVIYFSQFCCFVFQARNIKTGELAAVKIIKLEAGKNILILFFSLLEEIVFFVFVFFFVKLYIKVWESECSSSSFSMASKKGEM